MNECRVGRIDPSVIVGFRLSHLSLEIRAWHYPEMATNFLGCFAGFLHFISIFLGCIMLA